MKSRLLSRRWDEIHEKSYEGIANEYIVTGRNDESSNRTGKYALLPRWIQSKHGKTESEMKSLRAMHWSSQSTNM